MKGNKVMKKLISQILIIAMLLGTIGLVPSHAVAYDQTAIDFITTKGYWKDTNFDPSAAATRAQAASVLADYLSDLKPAYTDIFSDVDVNHAYANDIMLASSLGLVSGSGGMFRPDAPITREEFAVMLVKAHSIAGEKLLESNYLTELMIDYDSISSWAKTSVVSALGNGLMVSQEKKLFNPKGTVTVAELATATHNLYVVGDDYRTSYTVRDVTASDDIETDFTVVKNFSGYFTCGVSGAGMIAYFDGAPGEIYIKRDKTDIFAKNSKKNTYNNFGEPVCYARITDPNGNVVCYVDMDYLDYGVMEKIVNIPEGPEGIYQIQFTQNIIGEGGAKVAEQDKFAVGLKNPSSWGVRGEDEIVFVDDTLLETTNDGNIKVGYIYIPKKFDHLSIGIEGDAYNKATLELKDLAGNSLGKVTSDGDWTMANESAIMNFDSSQIAADSVLKCEVSSKFRGRLGMTGITPVIYESVEDALELKSGYIYHKDKYTTNMESGFLQLCGPIQQKARERMVEIYDEMGGAEGFTVDVESKKYTSLPENLDNPLAEAQPFSFYNHSISTMNYLIDNQCLNPSHPYFGIPTSATVPEKDYQTGEYGKYMKHVFTGLSLNSELNIFYNNEALIRRSELASLFLIMQLPADCMIRDENAKKGALTDYARYGESFFLGDGAGGFATSYYYVRNHYSPETRRITDQGVLMIMDKAMNITGQTPANQNMMAQVATTYTYKWSGEDRYHKHLKNYIMGFTYPALKDSGQNPLGYFAESFGADGDYGKMGETIWHDIVHGYLSLPDSMKDPELVAKIYDAEERYLIWDGYFIMPDTKNFKAVRSNNWTSREHPTLGVHRTSGENGAVINYFPRAKKNWLVLTWGIDWEKNYKTKGTANSEYASFSPASNAFVLTNDNWATSYLKYLFNSAYKSRMFGGNIYDTDGKPYSANHSEMYYVHHEEQQFEDSEMPTLPYETEGDYNFFLNENGIVSVKHKGMYMICYFNNAHSQLSSYSWIGGGPTNLWDDYFATTLNPRKPGGGKGMDADAKLYKFINTNNSYYGTEYDTYNFKISYKEDEENDFLHSCILGTDENSRKFVSGREKAKFVWHNDKKGFTISGTQTTSSSTTASRSKDIVWDYTLTDSGIEIKGGVKTYMQGQNLYMQLPIYVPAGATYTLDKSNEKIVISHNGNSITYDWDGRMYIIKEETKGGTGYKYLRILLTETAPQATVRVSRNIVS